MAKAMFAAGCFWCVEETFYDVPGVIATKVGYSGGVTENPTYEEVCTGKTGHAETVLVEYDPHKVRYERLLDLFWDSHDPAFERGPDKSQFRSLIFVFDDEQRRAAEQSMALRSKDAVASRPIRTQILPAARFFIAEDVHQQYYRRLNSMPCRLV